jgi:hypothetical protein
MVLLQLNYDRCCNPFRNSNYHSSEIPDSSLPAHYILTTIFLNRPSNWIVRVTVSVITLQLEVAVIKPEFKSKGNSNSL